MSSQIQVKPQLITLDVVIINAERVLVSSTQCSTTFANSYFIDFNVVDLLDSIKALARDAKVSGTKIVGLKKARLFIEENKDEIALLNTQYAALYEDYKTYWEHKVVSGIYLGHTGDDDIIASYQLRNQIDALTWRSTLLSKLKMFKAELNRTHDNIGRYTSVTLHMMRPFVRVV